MYEVTQEQQADGGWIASLELKSVIVQRRDRFLNGAKNTLIYDVWNLYKIPINELLFNEPKWRPYDYREIMKREPIHRIDEFDNGMIVQICPGAHTKQPYYAEIISLRKNPYTPNTSWHKHIMTLSVPGLNILNLDNEMWRYFHRRMTIIGYKKEFNHLLIGQLLTGIK